MKKPEVREYVTHNLRSNYDNLWTLVHQFTTRNEQDEATLEFIRQELGLLEHHRYVILNRIDICDTECTYCNAQATHSVQSNFTNMIMVPICRECAKAQRHMGKPEAKG